MGVGGHVGWAPVVGVLVVAGGPGALSPPRVASSFACWSQEGRWPGLRGGKSQDSRQRPARRRLGSAGTTPLPAVCPLLLSVLGERGPLGLFENGKKGFTCGASHPFALIFPS